MGTQLLKLLLIIPFISAFLLTAQSVHASLIGDDVNCDMQPGPTFWSCSSTTATVTDPGVEFNLSVQGTNWFNADIGDSWINLFDVNGGFGLGAGEVLTLSDLDWVGVPTGEIVGVSLITSGISGFVEADITFGAHSVVIDLNGTSWGSGAEATISLITTHVPEPSTLALLGIALAGIGMKRRQLH